MNSFIEVTEYKTGDKILFNTFHIINVRESYEEIKEKLN